MSKRFFIFGYGSLMHPRAVPYESYNPIGTAEIVGWQRDWCTPIHSRTSTSLGIKRKKDVTCNGVVFEVQERDFSRLQTRELEYQMVQLTPEELQTENPLPGLCYLFQPSEPAPASESYPINQTYIDVVVDSLFQFGDRFVDQFFESTTGWGPIRSDREAPRYPRHLNDLDCGRIDQILAEKLA